jgi:hypothetical protein
MFTTSAERLAWGKSSGRAVAGRGMQSDAEYFQRRAREERDAASRSELPYVRERHLEFAGLYEMRLRELSAGERRLSFRLVDAA